MGGLQTAHSSVVGDALKAGFQNFVDQSATRVATVTTGAPAAGYFYSSIVGRAPIPDISNDLRASFGVERIMTQQIAQLQNEFGTGGEPVYSVVGDDRGLIRFVSVAGLSIHNGAYGQAIDFSNGDYAEIVFYGTGLNILVPFTNTTGAKVIAASVDGGAEVANILPSSGSTVLDSRNYSPNIVVSAIPTQTLGVHTVKLRRNGGSGVMISGFEILNATAGSNYINLNTGTAYIQGQKVLNSVADSVDYRTGVTGTKGGRVVRYLNSDGTVSQAVTLVDTNSYTLTNTTHTNEEVARRHSYREFGAGGSEDFSLLKQADGSASRVFTLDDGTTTLSGRSVTHLDAAQVIGLAANPSFITITFVGTGLDLLRKDSGTGTEQTASVQVDGGAASNLSSANSAILRTEKIVSGLPYGTHTVKINWVSSTTYIFGLYGFTVYQPKKPTIPATAVELCDYNVMGDYALNSTTGTAGTISSGVLRKFATRENVYVGTWPALGIDVLFLCGYSVYTSTSGSYAEYVFFGTGINIKMYLGNSAQNFTLSVGVNGGSLSGNLSSYTSAFNYTGSGLTYTNTTGTVSGTSSGASGYNGAVFSLSGLPLGVHKVRFTLNNTTTTYVDALDIITPIHAVKSNLYADLQNTLPVGSCSLTDSRPTSAIKEVLPSKKAWAQAVAVSNPTTNSTSAVPLADMSVTIKTSGGPLDIRFLASLTHSALSFIDTYIYVDGVQLQDSQTYQYTTGGTIVLAVNMLVVPVSAGVHKVDIYWAAGSGATLSTGTGKRVLTVQEL